MSSSHGADSHNRSEGLFDGLFRRSFVDVHHEHRRLGRRRYGGRPLLRSQEASASTRTEGTDDDDNAKPWTPVVDCTAFPHEHIVPGASERFKCSICLQVMEEPVSIFPCGHSFDEACIKKHMAARKSSAKCPKGCDTVIERWVKLPDMRQIIRESVSARCIHDGCESVMTIDELPAHANACAHRRFRCSLRGSDGGVCGAQATRTEQQSHEDTCPHVVVQCGHGGCRKRPRRGALGDHMATCEWRPVVCKCGQTHTCKGSAVHKEVCLDEPDPCSICSALVTRRAMDAHMDDPAFTAAHIKALSVKVGELSRGVEQLKAENEGLKQEIKMLKSPGAASARSHLDSSDDKEAADDAPHPTAERASAIFQFPEDI